MSEMAQKSRLKSSTFDFNETVLKIKSCTLKKNIKN